MADSAVLPGKTINRQRHTPARVLGVFVVAFVAMTIMTVVQHRQRTELESTEAPTAVGDQSVFVLRRPIAWQRSIGSIDEMPLFLQTDQPIQQDDTLMRKIAWWRRYHIYQDSTSSKAAYFLKAAKGSYLPIGTERRKNAPSPN